MGSSDDLLSTAGGMSSEQIRDRLDELFREKAAVEGAIVVLLGEVDRRQAYRDEGATSAETWAVERFGVSTPTARALVRLSEKAWDLPHLVGGLCAGDLSLDKVRTVAGAATPENDRMLRARAGECSVRQLADVARTVGVAPGDAPGRGGGHDGAGDGDHDRRFLRFNDRFRTLSVQLPSESYAEVRACLETRARRVPSDGETRVGPALLRRLHGADPLVRTRLDVDDEPLCRRGARPAGRPRRTTRGTRVHWPVSSSATGS